MALANYNAIAALPGSFAIRFDSHSDQQDLWEHAPRDGDLLNHTPAAMFTDTAIYWIERVRGDDDGVTLTDDNGADYNAISIGFHRGDSTVAQSEFLGGLAAEWSWVLINETTEEWIVWPANAGQQGSGFATYNITPVGIVDTAGNDRLVAAVAQSFTLDSVLTTPADFQNSLISSELVVGLIPNNTFRPAFGPPPAPVTLAAETLAAALTLSQPTAAQPVVRLAAQPLTADIAVAQPSAAGTSELRASTLAAELVLSAPTLRALSSLSLAAQTLDADITIAQPTLRTMRTAGAPTNVAAAAAGYTTLDLVWDAPAADGGQPITGYEVRFGSGLWIATGSGDTAHRVEGLTPGTSYTVTVRAVNGGGPGAASAAATVRTLAAVEPGQPLRLTAEPVTARSVRLEWEPPADTGGAPITGYEVCVEHPDGTVEPFEPAGTATGFTVRGLAEGHRYGFRVRARNSVGVGPQTALAHARPIDRPTVTVPAGQLIPLIDTDRQSFIVRLDDIECQITVAWNPTDQAWHGSLEVPVGARLVTGRRLATGSGLLDNLAGVLAGNIVCRALDTPDVTVEPRRDAWERGSHGLVWEPAAT